MLDRRAEDTDEGRPRSRRSTRRLSTRRRRSVRTTDDVPAEIRRAAVLATPTGMPRVDAMKRVHDMASQVREGKRPVEWTMLAFTTSREDVDAACDELDQIARHIGESAVGNSGEVWVQRTAGGDHSALIAWLVGPPLLYAELAQLPDLRIVGIESALGGCERSVAELIDLAHDTFGAVGVATKLRKVCYLAGIWNASGVPAYAGFPKTFSRIVGRTETLLKKSLVFRGPEFERRSSTEMCRDYAREIVPRTAECLYATGEVQECRDTGGSILYGRLRLPDLTRSGLTSRQANRKAAIALKAFRERHARRVLDNYGLTGRIHVFRDCTISRRLRLNMHYDVLLTVDDLPADDADALRAELRDAWLRGAATVAGSRRRLHVSHAWLEPMYDEDACYFLKDRSRGLKDDCQEFAEGDLFAELHDSRSTSKDRALCRRAILKIRERISYTRKMTGDVDRFRLMCFQNLVDLDHWFYVNTGSGASQEDVCDAELNVTEVVESSEDTQADVSPKPRVLRHRANFRSTPVLCCGTDKLTFAAASARLVTGANDRAPGVWHVSKGVHYLLEAPVTSRNLVERMPHCRRRVPQRSRSPPEIGGRGEPETMIAGCVGSDAEGPVRQSQVRRTPSRNREGDGCRAVIEGRLCLFQLAQKRALPPEIFYAPGPLVREAAEIQPGPKVRTDHPRRVPRRARTPKGLRASLHVSG